MVEITSSPRFAPCVLSIPFDLTSSKERLRFQETYRPVKMHRESSNSILVSATAASIMQSLFVTFVVRNIVGDLSETRNSARTALSRALAAH